MTTRDNRIRDAKYFGNDLKNFPRIMIRKAPASGIMTSVGIRGFIV